MRICQWAMAATIVLLSATYPLFGFVRRVVIADITADRQQIEAAMATVGLELRSATENCLTFRATGLLRLTLLFEDEVTVCSSDEGITISGHRRTVIRAVIRLEGYLTNRRRYE